MKQLQVLAEKIDRLAAMVEADAVHPMGAEQAANYLSISKSYLYSLTSRALIPHFKTAGGKRLTFLKNDLDKWLLSHPVAMRSDVPPRE